MKLNYKRIGDCIRLVDERNVNLSVITLLGLSITKEFIPSVANIVGTDLKNYKIIRKNQFACSTMQVRRDKKMPVALLKDYDEAIISSAYPVFEVVDAEVILPEYLMMWFSRSEFDREACFYAIGGVRGSIEWEDFCNMKIPVPSIDTQQKIVNDYQVLMNKIDTNNRLIQKLEETAQIIYKHWFVDFEFLNEDGQPYKSNGGAMEFNEELDKEIPLGWTVRPLSDFCDIKGGKRLPKGKELNNKKNGNPYIKVADMCDSKFIALNDKFEYVEKDIQREIANYIVSKNDVIISIVGTIGLINIVDESLHHSNLTENCAKITNSKNINTDYLYHFLSSPNGQRIIETLTVGGVQGKLPIYNIKSIPIVFPDEQILDKFKTIITRINSLLVNYTSQNTRLSLVKDLLLSRLVTVEGSV